VKKKNPHTRMATNCDSKTKEEKIKLIVLGDCRHGPVWKLILSCITWRHQQLLQPQVKVPYSRKCEGSCLFLLVSDSNRAVFVAAGKAQNLGVVERWWSTDLMYLFHLCTTPKAPTCWMYQCIMAHGASWDCKQVFGKITFWRGTTGVRVTSP